MGSWKVGVKAGLRIACSNQKHFNLSYIKIGVAKMNFTMIYIKLGFKLGRFDLLNAIELEFYILGQLETIKYS